MELNESKFEGLADQKRMYKRDTLVLAITQNKEYIKSSPDSFSMDNNEEASSENDEKGL